ncbi:MAG TPA: glucose-6-phosphate isomerase [Actinobacteria bacterium]|nr:glucose-6-phosphate isomerase [Actinomycetota bacterium]
MNGTEGRAALHVALRSGLEDQYAVDGNDVAEDVHGVLERMETFAEEVRSGAHRGATGERITDIVNIGIGGSDLGPAMAYQALRAYRDPNITCHFVSNVDPADIIDVLSQVEPEQTLFIVASKTFTTAETMINAQRARAWIVDQLGDGAIGAHFAAVSTAEQHVHEFGIQPENVFGFWNWVGGRYSLTSAVGLSTMLAVGPACFRELLDGARAMDIHFRETPLADNAPVLMGLCAVWNRNFMQMSTSAVLPYSRDLARLPAYLQQLTMESNGKSVRVDGTPVTYDTGAVYWGEPGTNSQHSFFQLLHQGTEDLCSDIIISARPTAPDQASGAGVVDQHDVLIAHALAQASVLSVGLTRGEVAATGVGEDLVPHKVMPGNRPVSVIMMDVLTPFALGALLAAYEHSVFVQASVWQINPFDQWGVELGKKVASGIVDDIHRRQVEDSELDPATQKSLAAYLARRDEASS